MCVNKKLKYNYGVWQAKQKKVYYQQYRNE